MQQSTFFKYTYLQVLKGAAFMPLPYGFIQTPDSRIIVDPQKANIVRSISPA